MRRIIIALIFALLFVVSAPVAAQTTPPQYQGVEKQLKKEYKKVYFEGKYFIVEVKKLNCFKAATLAGEVFSPCLNRREKFKLIEIGGKEYLQAEGDGYPLYTLDGRCVLQDSRRYKELECNGTYFVLSKGKELYDNDFNLIVQTDGGEVSLKDIAGTCFIVISKAEYRGGELIDDSELYTTSGKLLQSDFETVSATTVDGLPVFLFKRADGLQLAFRYNRVAEALEPVFSASLNKTVDFGGKTYYWHKGYFYNPDGSLGFDKYVDFIGPDYLICRGGTANRLFGAYDENFHAITPVKWNYLEAKSQGKYRWFVASEIIPSIGYSYSHNHANQFINHVVDFNGNEYPLEQAPQNCEVKILGNALTVVQGSYYKRPVPGATLSDFVATPTALAGGATGNQPSAAPGAVNKAFPSLEIVEGSLRFIDPTGANAINAEGEYAIEFEVRNAGKGGAQGCVPTVAVGGASQGISLGRHAPINIAAGGTVKVTVPVSATMALSEGTAQFNVSVDEPNGFGTSTSILSVATHGFEAPKVLVSDYTVTSATGGTLQKKTPFDLQLLVQNVAHGRADDVTVSINTPANVYLIEGDASQRLATMAGGQTRELVYTLVANNNYADETIPLLVEVSEKHGKYAESRTLELKINQPLTTSRIDVSEAVRAPETNIEIARLNSDVDIDIPATGRKAEDVFVVVIANENYAQVPSVAYAANDGRVFAEYCRNTLGVPERNIRTVTNATLNEMKRNISWLAQVGQAYGEKATLILYYSGHGVPDEATGKAYILPVDGYHSDMDTNYALSDVYSSLSGSGAGRAIVFMDACFSGARRGEGTLVAARAVQIKAKAEAPKGKLIVFSAAQGDETAYPYDKEKHGMFTYFLLKKLQESRGKATLGELSDYITDRVTKTSLLENSKLQTPQVQTSPIVAGSWRDSGL